MIIQRTCPSCKTKLDRDLNASKNILKEGIKIISVGPSITDVEMT